MKKIVLTVFLVCVSALCLANPVSEKKAHQVAFNFLNKKANTPFDEIKLVYSQQFPGGEDTAYYVYSSGNSSFVIVAGDDIAKPIWGYSFDNGFSEKVPENVKGFLDDLVNELQAAREQGVRCDRNTQRSWTELTEGNAIAIANSNNSIDLLTHILGETNPSPQSTAGDSVAPLITTHWQQDAPYNRLCPLLSNGYSHSAVGCGAVALAQILRFWQYPENPRGKHTNPNTATPLTIGYDTVTFNYALMPNTVTATSSNAEKYEVARLLYYCGVALDMIYSTSDSVSGSATTYFAPLTSLVSFFRYNDSIDLARRVDYEDTTWISMLQTELNLGHPFIYRGGGSENHIFVCDGYNEANMFHFNMGHGGYDDGYYLLSSISMPGHSFNYSSSQLAILGIVPDPSSRTVTAQKHGISKFTVNDTMYVYRQRTLIIRNGNQFLNIGSDRNNHTMIFVPGDTTKQLKIEAMDVSCYDNVRIYDGENMDTLIDGINGYLQPNQYPKYSTKGAFVIRDSIGLSANDYVFRLTLECKKVTGLSHCINGDTLQLFWNENGNASNWQVEYGPTGFQHGEGTMVFTDTTICNVIGLKRNRQYDFYVRATCGNYSHSEWEMKRIIVPPAGLLPWKNIVTSQPAGYQIGTDGNIYIYSSEGLAWLISLCNGYNGATRPSGWNNKTIYLMADIDMSGGLWEALDYYFPKKLDGRNHTISGLTIFDTSSDYSGGHGFVESLSSGDTITNTLFLDYSIIYTNIYGETGGIVGSCHGGAIINCGINGDIVSTKSDAGGIVGTLFEGNILNCFSNVNIYGRNGYYGGIAGSGSLSLSSYSHSILNCYSSGRVIYEPLYTFNNDYVGVCMGKAVDNANASYLAYWLRRDTLMNGCGNGVSGFQPFEMDLTVDSFVTIYDSHGSVISEYTLYDTVWRLVSPTTIGGHSDSTLVDALNAWVDSNNSNGQYRRWTNDIDNINQGLPVFDITRYSVSLTCDSSMGSVSGGGSYPEDSQITISASANNCHHFTHWSDGNTNSTRTITVSQNISLTAIFASDAPSVGNVAATECDQYSWKGNTYTTSGTYTFDTLTSLGCDSIVSLSLTINHSDLTGSISITACNEYNWHGTTYYNSGVYTYSTTTTQGCDSLVTLNLTIGDEIVTFDTAVACDYYVWNGTTYANSGTYTYNTTSIGGCDSIATLILTINHPINTSTTEVTCDSIEWWNEVYFAGGTYLHTSVDTNGCTQTDTLFLTLHYSSTPTHLDIVIADTVLPFNYEGVLITEAGYYTIPLTNMEGCDSIVQLYVIVEHSGVGIDDVSEEIVIYPNPTNGIVTITTHDVLEVRVYDVLGCMVVHEKMKNIIDLSPLPNGTYIMKVSLPQGASIHKLIKQ